jgi:23S rRNA G2445 N2-methylase RlmL
MASEITKIKDIFFASCPSGLEQVLEEELKKIGIENTKAQTGGISFQCPMEMALKVILYSRIASKVFKVQYAFEIKIEKDLYFEAKKIKWKALFDLTQTFKIHTQLISSFDKKKRSKFKNSLFMSQQLKDAIVDRFRDDNKERPSVSLDRPDIDLYVRIQPNINPFSVKEDVSIMVDLCGEPLHQRGYRQKFVDAPLKENLAAGILKLIAKTKKQNFIDGMCGSGTFVIEQMLMDLGIAPSFLKVKRYVEKEERYLWAFENLLMFTKDKYLIEAFDKLISKVYKDTQKCLKKEATCQYLAYDNDARSVESTSYNATYAGLKEFIKVSKKDATTIKPVDNCVFFANPPYGERIGADLENLYHDLGENLKKNFKGTKAYILTGNLILLKKISLRTSKRIPLFNGKIECRLVEYDLY